MGTEVTMAQAKKAHEEGRRESRLPEDTRSHLRTARTEFTKSLEGLFPPGALEHGRNARREMLLAARSLIDHALERLEGAGEA